jgi:uncharacterized protein YyaL (SSP411 family)
MSGQRRGEKRGSGPAPNRLIGEKSPYLLQHAHNPVDWRPWGEEAFALARAEDKPVFLSVGYSTCHWCHVMARESFEDAHIARLLNRHFICVKVDREERPDVDRVYMTFVQATTGSGGWPMSVWLTPDLKAFYGGTYFPPEERWGRVGFGTVLRRIAEAWRDRREELAASGDDILRQLREATAPSAARSGAAPGATQLDAGYRNLKAAYDPDHGGFGGAPKFPTPSMLTFLFHYAARTGSDDARQMALFTLRRMAAGGIHDHLGGGFHRYSVDASWHVPHFEKMLYDQAQLACAYLDALQITGEAAFGDTARGILDYVLRDLTGEEGQFFSAEDADSPLPDNPRAHAEGAFYLWSHAEVVEALGREAADVFGYAYGVKEGGNAPDDPQGEFRGRNILIVRHTLEETARHAGRPADEVRALLVSARATLFARREQRPRPQRDHKALTAWNGLMISAFARGAQVLDDPRYAAAASAAARFLRARLYDPGAGTLLRRHCAGESGIDGYVDDYAFLIQGLIDLYETVFDTGLLDWAVALQSKQDERFRDPAAGGYYSTAENAPDILLRMKETHDGAEPSPNAVSALNLLRLGEMLDSGALRGRAAETIAACGPRLREASASMPMMLAAVDFSCAAHRQVVVAGRDGADDTRALLRAVHATYVPNKILLLADGAGGQEWLARHAAFIGAVRPQGDRATAYLCADHVCGPPVQDAAELRKRLQS